ncbi:MAG: universal stress protein [Ramlibacter sp.]|jgi:nucleotide-binding universal stress UspA family protein|nr:universal stress protein [Ramlibacter sp.]MCE3270347.1 universal stress protein [Ramlibacter sp.]
MKPLNVLVAVDDSEASLHACRLVAGYVGDRSTLRVTLLNVQRPPLRLFPDAGLDHAVLEAALREQGSREIEQALALLSTSGVLADSSIRVGPPADTILEVARLSEAGVLVMGGGRHGPVGGYAMGSVALRVAAAAPCPVVLVRPGARLPAEMGIRLRVAAPVDGSAESVQAVRRLVDCGALLGRMHVDLAHFRPGLTLAAAILPPHDDVLQDWSGRQSDAALDVPAKILAGAGISHDVHRLHGAPGTEIAAFARGRGAELIAMGTRGMGAMHHLLLGSAALKTALVSDVPLALLR